MREQLGRDLRERLVQRAALVQEAREAALRGRGEVEACDKELAEVEEDELVRDVLDERRDAVVQRHLRVHQQRPERGVIPSIRVVCR